MKKHSSLLLLVAILFAGKSFAQTKIPCYTDEMRLKYLTYHPEIATYEKQLDSAIAGYISNKGLNNFARTTADSIADTTYFDIPIVVHVMHNYGPEVIPDDSIYSLISEMNRFYSLQFNNTPIVPEFRQYIGKPYFRFHLATKDPNGNPTKGIIHHASYLAAGGDDEAKMDQWPPSSYLNIWFEERIGEAIPNGIVVAYAVQPPEAAALPEYDGIICNYSFINDADDLHAGGSIDHETGHIFYLWHTFGMTNNVHTNTSGNCITDDMVDDTPPTEGNLGGCNLYDTVCATNYYKIYPSVDTPGVDSLVNYPDTANEQNIMNYADCAKYMFTKGQVARMRTAAQNGLAGRSNLWSKPNLLFTGVLADTSAYTFVPTPDLPPITDFAVKNSGGTANIGTLTYFTCPGVALSFINESYQDTVTSVQWTFNTGGSSIPTAIATVSPTTHLIAPIRPSFSDPGWVSVTMAATGNNSGTTTTTYPRAAFVANTTATPGDGYYMEFNNSDTANWPTFNYYNNEFKWKLANVGYYDNSCIQYVGYDSRVVPNLGIYPYTGCPGGDFDDLFSIPMDLSAFTDTCNLNFYYSGASRSSNSNDINDTLEIDYSTDRTGSWHTLTKLTKSALENKGALSIAYAPLWQGDWAPKTIGIPSAARGSYVIFRFRYWPGNAGNVNAFFGEPYSSGNNFYMDRINFSRTPASVSNVVLNNNDIEVAPNPTAGDAYVIIKEANSAMAKIVVTDVTGKTIYTTEQQIAGQTQVLIPHSAIAVKGIYMVETITDGQVITRKLVVD